jgi:hypothetical protein
MIKVQERVEIDDYEIHGWRYLNENAWHIKLWPLTADVKETPYVVTITFDPTCDTVEERKAILKAIASWQKDPELSALQQHGLRAIHAHKQKRPDPCGHLAFSFR